MDNMIRREFQSFDELLEFSVPYGIVYFHVFEGCPDQLMCEAVQSRLKDYEVLIGLEASKNKGFLAQLWIPKKYPYIGSVTQGMLIDSTRDISCLDDLFSTTRRFWNGE